LSRFRRGRTTVTTRPLTRVSLLCLLALLLPACSWESEGTRKHLVFGFGIIETAAAPLPSQPDPHLPGGSATPASDAPSTAAPRLGPAATVELARAWGLFLGPGPIVNGFMLGALTRQSVIVHPDADLLLDAARFDDGRFIVTIEPVLPSHPPLPSPKDSGETPAPPLPVPPTP